jgi:aminopeptidase N
MDMFFSDLLLAHEVAHQWWGNLVTPADYRSDWLMEALANYSALQLIERRRGHAEFQQAMLHFTAELTKRDSLGKLVDSTGPVDLGVRLLESTNADAWRVITYDKGTWVMRMLCLRMGTDAFAKFLKQISTDYAGKQLSNEDFRVLASRFMPANDPDHSLELFFDTWVYGSGIPTLALKPAKGGTGEYVLEQTGVGPGFAADVPVTIEAPGKPAVVKWVRSDSDGASFRVPRGAKVSLPAPEDFLYVKRAKSATLLRSAIVPRATGEPQ